METDHGILKQSSNCSWCASAIEVMTTLNNSLGPKQLSDGAFCVTMQHKAELDCCMAEVGCANKHFMQKKFFVELT